MCPLSFFFFFSLFFIFVWMCSIMGVNVVRAEANSINRQEKNLIFLLWLT